MELCGCFFKHLLRLFADFSLNFWQYKVSIQQLLTTLSNALKNYQNVVDFSNNDKNWLLNEPGYSGNEFSLEVYVLIKAFKESEYCKNGYSS